MGLKIASDRIWVDDASGNSVFDTSTGMWRAMRFLSGYVDLSSYTATSTDTVVTPINVDNSHAVGTVPTACTSVIGMIQLVRSTATWTDPAGRWQAVNGSKLDINWMCGPLSSFGASTNYTYQCAVGILTFLVSSGSVTLREELSIRAPQDPATTWTSTRPATRVHYRLFAGAFV